MTLSAAEQFLLELINRARLDPASEAARNGIDLNAGLAAGTISTGAKQVLVANALLEQAAVLHTGFMIDADIFSHTGAGGSDPGDRILDQGYDWSTFGENIALVGSTAAVTVEGSVAELYKNLFLSEEHRVNTMNRAFAEVGLGAEVGRFTQGAGTFNAVLLTEDFATRSPSHFLTGVAYQDGNADRFYGMGEGLAGVVFQVGVASASTEAAGGYGLSAGNGLSVAVTGHLGALDFSLTVDMRAGNVKLDLVSGTTFFASGSVILGTGIDDLVLLGVARLDGTGNAAGNHLTGNRGANVLTGLGGADVLLGGGGADRLSGGRGNDRLTGGAGGDTFVFGPLDRVDRVTDFNRAGGDILRLDDALWAGQSLTAAQVVGQFGHVVQNHAVLEFAGGEVVHLLSVAGLAGLDGAIEIF